MGFKAWRNLSVLVFTGIALIGCNNGAQRDNRIVSGDKKGPPVGTAQTSQPPNTGTGFPMFQPKSPAVAPAAGPGVLPGASSGPVPTPFNVGNLPPGNGGVATPNAGFVPPIGAGAQPIPRPNTGVFGEERVNPPLPPSLPGGPAGIPASGPAIPPPMNPNR